MSWFQSTSSNNISWRSILILSSCLRIVHWSERFFLLFQVKFWYTFFIFPCISCLCIPPYHEKVKNCLKITNYDASHCAVFLPLVPNDLLLTLFSSVTSLLRVKFHNREKCQISLHVLLYKF
jgi:hypothetical protein